MLNLQKLYPNDVDIFTGSGIVPLYHGSKGGLKEAVRHDFDAAREQCDFGRGFYMGTNSMQAKTLICDGSCPTFYEINLDSTGLNCLEIRGILWILAVSWYRGFLGNMRIQVYGNL